MNIKLLLFILFLSTSSIIVAQNHMDIMTTMTGEHDHSHMGWIMTTLDWNGDGYDDLIINEQQWNPDGYPLTNNTSGKLLIYFGGPNFDNISEIVIPGHHQIEFSHTTSMCNAGDMNGDSTDDLALFRATMYEGGNDQNYDLQLCVFYGGAAPDTIPDFVLTFPREVWLNAGGQVRSLGDINHDGYDDIGYAMIKNYVSAPQTFGIIYGGSMSNTFFMEAGTSWSGEDICGIGDVNADGIDDFCIGYKYIIDNENERYSKVILYYGNADGVYNDSLLICEGLIFNPYVYPAGDVNWDGHADFASSFTGSSAKLYFGGPGFDGTNYVSFAPPYLGGNWRNGFSHGDVNGNGTSDLIATNVSQTNGYGDAYLWMGGVPMNGTPDLHLTPPVVFSEREMFGFCLTMGDYNADGYCDAAISAPFDYAAFPQPGRVFVYSGNPQLNDPTPIIDNNQIPDITKLQLYPNPLQRGTSDLNVKFTKQTTNLTSTFGIYNIRGQRVKSFTISAEQTRLGSAMYDLHELSSGVYVCVLIDGKTHHKGKVTVMK
jgi:hypothetical protein